MPVASATPSFFFFKFFLIHRTHANDCSPPPPSRLCSVLGLLRRCPRPRGERHQGLRRLHPVRQGAEGHGCVFFMSFMRSARFTAPACGIEGILYVRHTRLTHAPQLLAPPRWLWCASDVCVGCATSHVIIASMSAQALPHAPTSLVVRSDHRIASLRLSLQYTSSPGSTSCPQHRTRTFTKVPLHFQHATTKCAFVCTFTASSLSLLVCLRSPPPAPPTPPPPPPPLHPLSVSTPVRIICTFDTYNKTQVLPRS